MYHLALLSSGFIGFFGVYVNLDTTALGKSHNIDDKESSTRNSENVYSRQGMMNNRISERASFSGTPIPNLVYVFWGENVEFQINSEIPYKRAGGLFDEGTDIVSDSPSFSNFPSTAVSKNNVHLVW